MDPFALRAAFRVAILIALVALAMLPFQPAGSAEFVVSALAAIMGLAFLAIVALAVRLSGSRPPPKTVDRRSMLESNETTRRTEEG